MHETTARRSIHSRKIDRLSYVMVAMQGTLLVSLWQFSGKWLALAGLAASSLMGLGVAQIIEAIRESAENAG